MNNKRTKAFLGLTLLLAAGAGGGAEVAVNLDDKPPPKELGAAIREKLQTKAVQVLDGDKPIYQFWFCTEIPLQSKPASSAKSLDAVKPATLLGAVSIPAAARDYRDDELPAGIYTMRLALQPQDGNHLGTSEYAWFAVLVPGKDDLTPEGISDYKALVKASSKETSTDHPLILSLRPAPSPPGSSPILNAPAPQHKSVRVSVPAKAGEEKTSLLFEVVFRGTGKK